MNQGKIKIRTDKLMELTRRSGPLKNKKGYRPKKSNMTYLRRILRNIKNYKELTMTEENEFTIFKYSF